MPRNAIAAFVLVVLSCAVAEARYACAVKRSPDGFIALREGPSGAHAIVARMRAQELVLLLDPKTEDIVRSGEWLSVRWYPGTRRTASHIPDADEKIARHGWVHESRIHCFEE